MRSRNISSSHNVRVADAEEGSSVQLQCSFPRDHFERHPHLY